MNNSIGETDPVQAILERLDSVKKSGSGWIARCPSHSDGRPSLSIGRGDDGRVLLKCFAGCSTERIVAALGLEMRALFPRSGDRSNGRARKSRTFSDIDDAVCALQRGAPALRDAEVTLHEYDSAFAVLRFNCPDGSKSFRPIHKTGDGWRIGDPPGPLPLYRVSEVPPDGTVYVVEGERCADAARMIGLAATCSAHGAKSGGRTGWQPLAARDVAILPDNDEAGERYARDVAGILCGLGCAVRIVTLPDLPEHGDIYDFIENHDSRDSEDLKVMVEAIAGETEPWQPQPATATGDTGTAPNVPAWEPFPVSVLPERVARFVEAVARSTGTDPSWAAVAALVTAAGCVGNRAACVVKKGWSEPVILWAALVGKSGTTKTAVLKHVTRPLVELVKDERDAFRRAMTRYLADMERFGVKRTQWRAEQKKSTDTLSEPPREPEPPAEKRVLVADITVEKVAAVLGDNPLGLLVVRDELAGLIGSFDRYANTKGGDLQAWLAMHDGAALLVDRKTAGSVFVEKASVSVLGAIQPGTLQRVFGTAEREAGLLARMLLVYPPDRPGLWTDAELPDAVAANWKQLLADLLAMIPTYDDAGRPRPRYIGVSRAAKALFVAWHDRHARQLADLDDDDLRSHWSKLKGMCARIALLFSCIDAAPEPNVGPVSAESMERAIGVVDWLKRGSARIYAMLDVPEDVRERKALADLVRRKGGTVSCRDIVRASRRWPTTEAAAAALDGLVKAGYGRWESPAPSPTGGRPVRRFRLAENGGGR